MDAFAAQIEAMARARSGVLNRCLDMADNFFGAGSSQQGQEAYDATQKDFCKCCE
jgi:hypothetical protein